MDSKVDNYHFIDVYQKEGFKNFGHKEYAIINLATIEKYFNDGDTVSMTSLFEKGLIQKEYDGLKVLGNGELTKKVTIVADKISNSASEKIEKCGAKAEISK